MCNYQRANVHLLKQDQKKRVNDHKREDPQNNSCSRVCLKVKVKLKMESVAFWEIHVVRLKREQTEENLIVRLHVLPSDTSAVKPVM